MDTDHEFLLKVDKPRIHSTIELDEQKIESIKFEPLTNPMEPLSSPPIVPQKRLSPVIELPAPQRPPILHHLTQTKTKMTPMT